MSKIKDFINKHFYRVFDKSHVFYTMIYLISALLIGFLSLISGVGNFILFFATVISLTFIILLIIGILPNVEEFLFSEEDIVDLGKVISFLSVFLFCCIILVIYFLFGSSNSLTIQFLGWDILLPTFFIVVFFGWNVTQIWFLRLYIEDIATKVEEKLMSDKLRLKNKERLSLIFLIIALIVPVILNISSIGYFSTIFIDESTGTLATFVLIIVLMFIVIGITSIRQIILYLKSKENNTPNIFSSIFYILIWLYIWYRSFSFINAFSSASQTTADILTAVIDIILMVAVAISVLRSLGNKVSGVQVFNQNNIAFFLYAFTLLYIEGQVIMLTGAGALKGVFSEAPQISLVNNFIILLVSIFFYIYYSSYIIQRKGLINKTQFTPSEVITILSQYRNHLYSRGYLDLANMNEREFEMFLEEHNLNREKEKASEKDATGEEDISGENIEKMDQKEREGMDSQEEQMEKEDIKDEIGKIDENTSSSGY